MTDFRLRAIGRPGNGQDIEAGLTAEQVMSVQEEQSQIRQATLLSVINRFGRANAIFPFRGSDFDEDDAVAVERDQIQLSARASEIAAEDPITKTLLEEARGSALGT
jgi:hypothetical protein